MKNRSISKAEKNIKPDISGVNLIQKEVASTGSVSS